MSTVKVIFLIDDNEWANTVVEVNNETLARDIATAMSSGMAEGYLKFINTKTNEESL